MLRYPSDLLVLKHAQRSYGVDEVAGNLADIDPAILPAVGGGLLIQNPPRLAARNLLFIGVEPVETFDYRTIRDFSRRALTGAAHLSFPVRSISMTLHGVGFGLDEIEAFESEVAGVVEALDAGHCPEGLLSVDFVEQNENRARRMQSILLSLINSEASGTDAARYVPNEATALPRRLDSVGYDSAARPHAFVAMPFADRFTDVFHYGIVRPVRAAGLLCERMDQIHFTGDVINRMKERIAASKLVIADLSDANPNVYLEVGYAWGLRVPCVLVCSRETDLKFDVRGQRCLFYGSIRDLEKQLSAELKNLAGQLWAF
ncbi:hypothetical protein FDG2_0867 [Candidatus Protofrankia californiensis]|uniref:Nucleoside 2-deoxyribosyltransferase n=1 Tax=Candidatus Protofrankia californiensis TaxID=1839754 RepID=A0A1C3NUI4_9ACTN|nr:hypothetical protein FDG2_0867 [Candidatus Protofrankia californiensis]